MYCVVELKEINSGSPFSGNPKEYAVNRELLKKINNEMSKVLRRNDSILDYIPTQYISDCIKGALDPDGKPYAGIEYKSTMYPEGYNLAIFYPKLFDCVEVKVHKVKELYYQTT